MSQGKVGFGLVGCGRILAKHAVLLAGGKVRDSELVALCDTNLERARAAGARYGVPCYGSMQEMVAAHGQSIGVLSILTPSGSHAQNCVEAASYGKHVVVEKPMALTLNDADAMIRACDEAGVKLFVVKQNRYNLPVLKMREALEAGRFGKLVMGTVRVRWCRPEQYYRQDAWRGTWQHDGGVFANQASHHVDLLQWMLGEVESVYAVSTTALAPVETEDTGAAVLRFKNGAIGIVEATTATRPRDLEGSLSLLGSRGTVEIGGFAVNEMKVWAFQDEPESSEDMLANYRENPPDVYGYGHQAYLNHVVDSIQERKRALVDGLEGRKSLELITAIYESVETRAEVNLRFAPRRCKLGLPG